MAKPKRRYVCQACGSVSSRWQGQCPDCAEWNTLVEEAPQTVFSAKHDLSSGGRAVQFVSLDTPVALPQRRKTGLAEFDRALGGGLVPGSAILMGGDPGIGKSTLLLQTAASIANAGGLVVYISGEEASDQIRLRADRLGLGKAPIRLASTTSVRDILTTLGSMDTPALLVIDSIQTMHSDQIEGAPGTVSQVRGCAFELIRYAKENGVALVLVGHVTKDGSIAGPRVLEHMVDVVMSFEGSAATSIASCARSRTALARSMKSACSPWPARGWRKWAIPRCCSFPAGKSRCRAARCFPPSKAPGRCWWKSRRSPCGWPAARRRAAPWSAGIPGGSPCCSPCSIALRPQLFLGRSLFERRGRLSPDRSGSRSGCCCRAGFRAGGSPARLGHGLVR
jgi:energy-coupling factor transporter ATP-binding protein EcfA2